MARVVPLRGTGDTPRVLEDRDDDELMLLARGGRAEAFDVLVRRHQQRILRYSYKVLGDAQLARDAAQSTFVELYRYLPRYQARGTFTVFLTRLALNQCRMSMRAGRTRARHLEALGHEPAPGQQLPDQQLLEAEQRRDVEKALATLGDTHRDVLTLRFAGGLSLEEVSETLGVPVGTVKSRIFNGLKQVRALLAKEDR